jgi:NifU-like protein
MLEEANESLRNAAAPQALNEAQRNELIAYVIQDMRPGVMQDGGDLELIEVDGDKVVVKLSGKCTTCSMAGHTLGGVRRRLMSELGTPVRVVPQPT